MIAILMNYKSFKKIIFILITFSFFPVIVSMESFAYTCDITNPEVPGCCGPGDCSGWYSFCFPSGTTVPTKCRAEEGTCICNDWAYCNSAVAESCQYLGFPGDTHQCDNCCCTLAGGTPGDPDPWDPPDPNIWYGVYGRVWSDFNNNGTRDEGEDWKGLPQYDTDGRCAPTTHQQDFSVIVNGENIARAWWCVGTPRIHTTRFEYYSHHEGAPGWVGLNAGMSRGNYYTATLGNMPSGSSCGTWTVYNSDGSLQGNGAGCDASFLFTTVNNYMVIDWKLGPAGCTSNSDCNDNLFCTDDICNVDGTCSNPSKSCDDSNVCTTDFCDEDNDSCNNDPIFETGSLGPWGSCSGGSQTSTCNDFSCGGSCSAECTTKGGTYNSSTNICTRNCLYVEGNIWSDDNGNLVRENSENWWNPNYSVFCSTSKSHPSFYLTYTGHTGSNQINEWYCNGNNSYYRSPFTGPVENIEPEQPHTFTLSGWPDGYKPKSWVYNHPGYSISGNWSGFGSFSTSSIIMPTSGWTNVHWELQQQTYNLTIKVKDIPPETLVEYSGDSCTLDLSVLDDLSDATVIISSATGAELCNKTTDSNGEVTCDIWVNQGLLDITVRKRVSDEEVIRIYSMVCPSKGSYPYDPGDVADGDSKTELVGLKESYKESWVSAVDSDIFANEVNVVVPLGTGSNPAGFVKALLNSYDNITGGFVFSKDQITNPHEDTLDEGTTYNLLFEDDLGGRAENLDSGGSNHNSKWLESFTFEAPNGATEISDLNTSLNSGVIYKSSGITTLPNTYTLSGTGVAVLYIDNDLTINNNFTTSSSGRLLLVVNGSVTISKDVGTDVGSFMLSQDPNIEAGIIASGKIEFGSIGGSITENRHDDPIMVSAPLITRDLTDGIIFSRDLYTDNNATMPAESAKAFNKYLYLLTSLEREKSQDNLYFTGLTTYDLDWEYIY